MTLKEELDAEDGSFLLEIRTQFSWNHNGFVNLLTWINEECKRTKGDSRLTREIAAGIWYSIDFIKDWVNHENFPKVYSTEYYERAFELLSDLGYYYFMGESPYESDDEIENKIDRFKTFYNKSYK